MVSNLEVELESLLINYPETIKRTITNEFNTLESKCLKLLEKILPTKTVPLYMSMVNSESINDREKLTTWNDYQSIGDFSEFNDQYCRPVNMVNDMPRLGNSANNKYMYPERQINGDIELKPCDILFTDNIKSIANIASFIPGFIDIVKGGMITLERNNSGNLSNTTDIIDNKIAEFEYLEKQRIQNEKLIDNHNLYIKERRDDITNKQDKLLDGNNNYNIKKDTLRDYLLIEQQKQTRNTIFKIISKSIIFILWCIILGLVLFHNIGYIK